MARGHVSVSRYMARLRAIGADLGQDTIMIIMLTTDVSCSFQLMNIRKIRSSISCVIVFLS